MTSEDTTDSHSPDGDMPPLSAEEIVAALQEQLAERDMLAVELKDRLTRQLAETENVRRRLEKEKQDANIYALRSFARDLLGVSDNLRRALDALPASARANPDLTAVISGVEVTERELLQVFGRFGIAQVEALGQKLDPNLHQAMAEIENAEQAPGTILQVYQQGYAIKGQLLRPAMVVVAKAVSVKEDSSPRVDTTA
jgi:molecular chaperone GrpE